MALVVKDRVKETTATTGTGTLTLAGAVTGFQSFSSALSNADTTYYAIFESSTGAWEVGLGTFTSSGTTLSRDTILESSNAGSAINLTAGAAEVFITQPAEKAVYLDANGYIFASDGRNLTNLNASNISSGTIGDAYLPASISSDITGNAATATKWATGRTISLTGDVTGTSAAFDGSGNLSFATTIAADSVALGTDTTGNYVATGAVSGNGLSGSASAEGATFTVTSNATNANTASTIVFRDASGNFSAGTITAALTGNASTASAWATGRTLSLTGDVTGTSASFDGSGNISIATTIAADSVALGTDTTGNYVATGAVSGNGLSGSASAEGATFTVTSNATNANTASTIVFRDASGNFSAGTITATLTGTASNANTLNNISAVNLFNNMGQTHSTRTSFDVSTPSYDFGWRFVQGSTNGPGTGGSQFYSWYVGLGSEYPATGAGSYGAMFAIDRNSTAPYLSVRFNESNSFGTWRRINAGNADTVGGLSSSQFLRSDAADSTASTISFTGDIEVGDQILHSGDTDTYMQFHAADQWRVVTGGVERLEVTNSGVRIDDAFTLPTTDGTSGQALVTNGSGTVTWGSAGISTGKAIAMAIVFG